MLLLLSCQDVETIERPNNLIPEQKMAEVLTELALLNSAKNYNKRFLEQTGLRPNDYLYQKFDIDSLQLAESTRYYANNYTQFERIYRRVQQNLEKMKTENEIIAAQLQKEKDSISNLGLDPDSIMKRDSLLLQTEIRKFPLDSLDTPPVYDQELDQ